jgi:ubiquinone/menaquinone biosynthesis C-methylase UbiE
VIDAQIHLARRFGCAVVGVDLAPANAAAANAAAAGLAERVRFGVGDAERLPVGDGAFTAALCECAFCTFPDKPTAAAELAGVLAPGGRVGLSDLTRRTELPAALWGLLAWVACVADARPIDEYVAYLLDAGFEAPAVERHDRALAELVGSIRQKLLGAQVLAKIGQLSLPGVDWEQATAVARAAAEATRSGRLGYAAIVARKPGDA